jgi:hypothetical protein
MRFQKATAAALALLGLIASFPGNVTAQSVSAAPSASLASIQPCDPDKQRYADSVGVPCSALRAIDPAMIPAPVPDRAATPPAAVVSRPGLEVGQYPARYPESYTAQYPSQGLEPGSMPGLGGGGPSIAYARHAKSPALVDGTPVVALLGLVGAGIGVASGHDIVSRHAIADPSSDMARTIAAAYATAKGGHVVEAPVPYPSTRARRGAGADQDKPAIPATYVVDVDPPSMILLYFATDFFHYDITFDSRVRIIDAADGRVVAMAKCSLSTQKAGTMVTRGQLLDDNAARLKQLIASKSEACVASMRTRLAI